MYICIHAYMYICIYVYKYMRIIVYVQASSIHAGTLTGTVAILAQGTNRADAVTQAFWDAWSLFNALLGFRSLQAVLKSKHHAQMSMSFLSS